MKIKIHFQYAFFHEMFEGILVNAKIRLTKLINFGTITFDYVRVSKPKELSVHRLHYTWINFVLVVLAVPNPIYDE